jgi:hypothetical protein
VQTILVYEDGNVNEYELCYDHDYMKIRLEEYKKTFSLLRKGNLLVDNSFSKETLKKVTGGIEEFVAVNMSNCDDDGLFNLEYIVAINPTVYNILSDENGFILDNKRIHALYAWYHAIKSNFDKEQRDLSLASFDYYNLDDKIDLKNNISDLLADVSLTYVGEIDSNEENMIKARRNSIFINEFGIKKNNIKKLKK